MVDRVFVVDPSRVQLAVWERQRFLRGDCFLDGCSVPLHLARLFAEACQCLFVHCRDGIERSGERRTEGMLQRNVGAQTRVVRNAERQGDFVAITESLE